jgi:hypothetical protein
MKDQNGKELNRPFPKQRNPADKYRVTVVPTEHEYEVTQDGTRPVVKKDKE